MDLTIVPYGNAQMSGDTVSCQHGPDECQGNAIEQCAFSLYDVYTAFPFYLCMEQAGENMLNEVQDCATSASLSYDKLADCFNNATTVTANQKAAAAATPADHTYTPWVVVDGTVMTGNSLLETVCAAYAGDAPAGCPTRTKRLRAVAAGPEPCMA